ncbi:hypothetical protein LCGC14_3152410, partial [marine sediment metagenome]
MIQQECNHPLYSQFDLNEKLAIISGTPFLLIKQSKTLVFGDLHFGQEYAIGLLDCDVSTEKSILAEYLLRTISDIRKTITIDNLVLNGDIKHEIFGTNGQEINSLQYFLNDSRVADLQITLIKGNHDVLLRQSLRHIQHNNITICDNICEPPICIFHGHEDNSNTECEIIILSHEHPSFIFRGNNFEKVRIMAFVTLKSKTNTDIVILPPANFISSGV